MNSNKFSPGDPVRHRSYGLGNVIQDDGGAEVVVKFLNPDSWEQTDTLSVARSSLSKVESRKRNKWEY